MIRVALVGAGAIARVHAQAFLRFDRDCELVAVCNQHPEKAQALIRELGISARAFSSLEEAAAVMTIDAVSICLPPAQHPEISIWALRHGLHVLVEKPMANSLEECDRMIAAAEASGRLLSVICQLRFTTSVHRLRTLLHSGEFGRVRYATVNSLWFRGEHYHDIYWRGTWEGEGGGVMTAQAIHHVDLLQYMIGMPERITACMANVGHRNTQCEDVATAILEYDDLYAQITASLVAHGEKQELCFYTEQGRFALPWEPAATKAMANGFPSPAPEVEERMKAAYQAIPPLDFENHAGQIGNFLRAIRYGEPLVADGAEGRKPVEIVTAIYKSAALHCPVELPLAADDPFYTTGGKAEKLPHFYEKRRSVDSAEGTITLAGGV